MFCTGADAARVPAPTIGDDGGWHDGLADLLVARLAQRDLALPSDLLAGAAAPGDLGMPEPGPDAFWAVRPGASVATLLADIALTDHRRAAAGRSYWWVAGQDAPLLVEAAPDAVQDALTADPGPASEDADSVPEDVPPHEADPGAAPTDGIIAETRAATSPAIEPGTWDLPDLPQDDDSPFASGGGLGLFAAPLPADPAVRAEPTAAPAPMPAPVPRVLASQVWAGTGLPNGQVLAWFLCGVSTNG
jgi:hypothetical protein